MPEISGGSLALALMVAVGVVLLVIAVIPLIRTGFFSVNVRRKS